MFKKATKSQARLRIALIGPAGSGKTFSALNIAKHLGFKTAVLDSERGSASLYSDMFDFDVAEMQDEFSPQAYINVMRQAERGGYDCLIIDSLSHAWMGKGGVLEMVDEASRRNKGNKFGGWRDASPEHNKLVDAILQSPLHIIATMRSKVEYIVENVNGKNVPRKVGMQPVQREGLDFEFTVVGDMDDQNNLTITKTRIYKLGLKTYHKPGEEFAGVIRDWLTDAPETASPQPTIQPPPPAQPTHPATGMDPAAKAKIGQLMNDTWVKPSDLIKRYGKSSAKMTPEEIADVVTDLEALNAAMQQAALSGEGDSDQMRKDFVEGHFNAEEHPQWQQRAEQPAHVQDTRPEPQQQTAQPAQQPEQPAQQTELDRADPQQQQPLY